MLIHWCIQGRGHHRGYVNVRETPHFLAQTSGQTANRKFARYVGASQGLTDQAQHGTYIDQCTATALPMKLCNRRSRTVGLTEEVRLNYLAEGLVR